MAPFVTVMILHTPGRVSDKEKMVTPVLDNNLSYTKKSSREGFLRAMYNFYKKRNIFHVKNSHTYTYVSHSHFFSSISPL